MIRALLISAIRTGPFAAFCMLYIVRNGRFVDLLLGYILIAFVATIIAFIAGAVLFMMFQNYQDWRKLSLTPKQEYVYFLPLLSLLFVPFALWAINMEADDFGQALAISTYLSAFFGWTNYCSIKHKNLTNQI